jgi:hypothetical protein
LCWAMTYGEEEGVRQRHARRRTRQHGAAYRIEAMTTSGQSCRNSGEVRRPVSDGRGRRGVSDVHLCWGRDGATSDDLRGNNGGESGGAASSRWHSDAVKGGGTVALPPWRRCLRTGAGAGGKASGRRQTTGRNGRFIPTPMAPGSAAPLGQ